MIYIGIDNGTTGSIAMLDDNGVDARYWRTPIIAQKHYTKEMRTIHRVDVNELRRILSSAGTCKCLIERPFTGKNVVTMLLAARAFEATLIVLEELKIPYDVLDSKEWQKALLPSGIFKKMTAKNGRVYYKADSKKLKQASKDTAKQWWPKVDLCGGDGDSLLIAEYARRKDISDKPGGTI